MHLFAALHLTVYTRTPHGSAHHSWHEDYISCYIAAPMRVMREMRAMRAMRAMRNLSRTVGRGQSRTASRYACGPSPVSRRNAVLNALGEPKPQSAAMDATEADV
ncbi:hypothetical protein G1C96_0904 [Bifidobacterium sp. DSM 109958]|uniref:Uncharacterized protein n=1 Tax=Bifidobacterium moraviense TaxID=2675323 RepID=A0A7Y0F1N1_9BIFI|nr:hypothetical protein [Bifidobacterium sp. DSM 109958]